MEKLPKKYYCLTAKKDQIVLIEKGTKGYYPVESEKINKKEVTRLNKEELGLDYDPKVAREMVRKSMFGWD